MMNATDTEHEEHSTGFGGRRDLKSADQLWRRYSAAPIGMAERHGWTTAVDRLTGAAKWHVKMATPMVAALTPTAGGLLFTGNLNGEFMALDAATGDVLFRNDTRGALAGGVITYRAGGTQYVAAARGNTSFVAWTITGKPTLMIFGL